MAKELLSGRKSNRMAFVLFGCDEQRHIPQVIRVIREIRVLKIICPQSGETPWYDVSTFAVCAIKF